ncbi:S-adenosyl-L-methionine-dependent methyltransferase [Clathrospora elynae]|uniref:S-adenosyl-L-methionine-dependent methyltransferase n=1 Tax=Clathrospora elynae TaxID=706981 RepID=A0A6A5SMK2_9PLEO|nr:S-adenosyl-L-methionine-dependent methyltransferase [Clathrospora elynae]
MSLAEANRRFFDAVSGSYDNKPWFAEVNKQVTSELRDDLVWAGIPLTSTSTVTTTNAPPKEVRLLDYASGTGLMTRIFGPYVTSSRAIDISPNMVTSYNARARDAGLGETVVKGVVGDLFDKSHPSPAEFESAEWWGFDVAAVGFAFHHFADVAYAAGQLKARLRPGGVLVISDFLEGGDVLAGEDGKPVLGSEGNHAAHMHGHKHDDGSGHAHDHHHHHHHGEEGKIHDVGEATPEFKKKMNASIVVPHFTLEGVRQFFAEAGFVDVDVKTMKERSYMEFAGKKLWRTILFAKGRRPVEDGQEKSEL